MEEQEQRDSVHSIRGDAERPSAASISNAATKHTPGPWTTEKQEGDEWWFGGAMEIVLRAEARPFSAVCVLGATDQEGEADADARLIAAAPELLAALREAVALADANCALWDGKPHRTPECQAAYDKCVAAIAKATEAA